MRERMYVHVYVQYQSDAKHKAHVIHTSLCKSRYCICACTHWGKYSLYILLIRRDKLIYGTRQFTLYMYLVFDGYCMYICTYMCMYMYIVHTCKYVHVHVYVCKYAHVHNVFYHSFVHETITLWICSGSLFSLFKHHLKHKLFYLWELCLVLVFHYSLYVLLAFMLNNNYVCVIQQLIINLQSFI